MRINYGEWSPDSPSLDAPLLLAQNVMPYGGHYRPFLGASVVTSALPAAPLAAISTSIQNNISETYAATATNLYRLGGPTWTACTGAAVTPSSPMQWEFAQYGNYVLAASLNNELRQVLIGGGMDFAAITDAPKSNCVGVVRNFVMCGDINDPTDGLQNARVRWSAIDDPLLWPLAGTSAAEAVQSDQQDLRSEDGAVRAIFATDVGIIFQERSITRASYVGTPLIFQFDSIDDSRGLVGRYAAAQVGRAVYFLSEDGFFVTDGSGESVPIGNGKVDRYFYGDINRSKFANIQTIAYPLEKCIVWFYASKQSDANDSAIIYNYGDKRWSSGLIAVSLAVNARTAGYTLEQLDAFGTMETISASLDSDVWRGGASFPGAFDGQYRLGSLNGSALTATFETGDLIIEGRRAYVSGVRPLNEGGQTTVTLGTKKLISDPIVWGAERAVTPATGKADFRSSAFYHRIRTRIAGGFTKALGVDAVMTTDDGEQ